MAILLFLVRSTLFPAQELKYKILIKHKKVPQEDPVRFLCALTSCLHPAHPTPMYIRIQEDDLHCACMCVHLCSLVVDQQSPPAAQLTSVKCRWIPFLHRPPKAEPTETGVPLFREGYLYQHLFWLGWGRRRRLGIRRNYSRGSHVRVPVGRAAALHRPSQPFRHGQSSRVEVQWKEQWP